MRAAEAEWTDGKIHYVIGWAMEQNSSNRLQYFDDEEMSKCVPEYIVSLGPQR